MGHCDVLGDLEFHHQGAVDGGPVVVVHAESRVAFRKQRCVMEEPVAKPAEVVRAAVETESHFEGTAGWGPAVVVAGNSHVVVELDIC